MLNQTLALTGSLRVSVMLLALCCLPFTLGAETISEHATLTYTGPGVCLQCHTDEAHDVFGSSHYQWQGPDPFMLNSPNSNKSKLSDVALRISGAVNSYCGNILGNWGSCNTCHIGRGAMPTDSTSPAQLENIDCLMCHQKEYKRKRDANGMMVPDLANMTISMDQAVRTVHKPERTNCLQCHAKAGGGDAVKRGDLALATANTLDEHYDVHMATTGENLQCQDCHVTQNHRIAGKGSDLRTTDLNINMGCGNSGCHRSTPHEGSALNRHTAKVACQTCHIPVYGKDAADTLATEATETHRSWQAGTESPIPPFHPVLTKENDLTPKYKFWNGYSTAYLLGDLAVKDPATGAYPTSRPAGSRTDPKAKLYPFKYKTSDYPMRTASNQLIALDTKVFFATADADAAALSGLQNMIAMGYPFQATDDVSWVTTDTYQLLNHQVGPEDDALQCTQCHFNNSRMDLQGGLGYKPSKPKSTCAAGCHSASKASSWRWGSYSQFTKYHDKHVRDKGYNCNKCHAFSK